MNWTVAFQMMGVLFAAVGYLAGLMLVAFLVDGKFGSPWGGVTIAVLFIITASLLFGWLHGR